MCVIVRGKRGRQGSFSVMERRMKRNQASEMIKALTVSEKEGRKKLCFKRKKSLTEQESDVCSSLSEEF